MLIVNVIILTNLLSSFLKVAYLYMVPLLNTISLIYELRIMAGKQLNAKYLQSPI